MARVTLIGDSIRNSYEPIVIDALSPEGHEVWGLRATASIPCSR